MMSNSNENNKPKPSAALAEAEKYLKYIAGEIQKLENGTRDDKSINSISQLEQALNSLWKQIIQFIENELTVNRNRSIKSEQEITILEQQYSKFTDNYLNFLDKTNETALSILKTTLPIIPALLAINVQIQWVNITSLRYGFIILSIIAIFTVVIIGNRRKNYIRVEAKRLLDEIDETKRTSQKLITEAAATHQYANELLNYINTSLSKLALLKDPQNNSNS